MSVQHHTVVVGDTLTGIANQYGITVNDIAVANSWIENINLIQPGWVFHIPVPDAVEPPTEQPILLGINHESGGYTDHMAITGKQPHIWHAYATRTSQFVADVDNCPEGCIPLLNLKPNGGMGADDYQAILDGVADRTLSDCAAKIISYGGAAMVCFMHEPENDDGPDADTLYAQAYRYCVEFWRGYGVTNVEYVWNMMGYYGHSDRLDDLYPGDAFVDTIASDPYCHDQNATDFSDFVNKSTSTEIGFYDWLIQSPTRAAKPFMLAEWGIGENGDEPAIHQAVPPELLTQRALDVMRIDYPNLFALVYWSQQGSKGDYRITNFPDDWKRFTDILVP